MTKQLCFIPLRFGLPPWSRDDVYQAIGHLPGYNQLERSLGDADPAHFELRLEVDATSPEVAVLHLRELFQMYFSALQRYGPELRDEMSAMPYQEYLDGVPPPRFWRSMSI
jgi:hypothetical protein